MSTLGTTDPTELTCTTCGQTKPVDDFPVRSSAPNGRRGQCRPCYRARHPQPSRKDRVRKPKAAKLPKRNGTLPVATWSVEREEWQAAGRCRQKTTMFFPTTGGNANLPKLICQACPVQFQCLEYAIRTEQRFGIWGGKSEKERQDILRRRKRQGAVA